MKSYKLLLALSEEDPCGLKAIGLALEDCGYHVTTATSSWWATEALHAKHFDLVITNLLDILKKAKEVSPDTIVVILTDDRKITFVIRALRLGADDCFIKPLDPFELRELATYCLKKVEYKRRNSQFKSHGDRSNGEILNTLKTMSHDIRGSLLSISATLKLLNRGYFGKMDEGVANSLSELLSKTIGLIGITEEYLGRTFWIDGDFGREDETWDLMQDIINPVLEELSLELREHRIRVDLRFDVMSSKGIPIKASRIGLKAVFRNLFRNAIKYGGKGCIISLGFEEHGGSYQLNVHNSGDPIPEEYRDKLFSKFMQLGRNGTRNGGAHGMGLGLYFTKKIIEKQGGAIWYEAEESGSNFVFTLPSGLTFPAEPLLPINPAQPRMAIANT